MFRRNQLGFTLIELVMVIGVIALISSISMFALIKARIKARNARRATDLTQLQKSLELYYSTNGYYPNGGAVANANQAYDISNLTTFLVPSTISKIPYDPSYPSSSLNNYQYMWGGTTGTNYSVLIRSGNEIGGSDCVYRSPGASSTMFNGTAVCNFQ